MRLLRDPLAAIAACLGMIAAVVVSYMTGDGVRGAVTAFGLVAIVSYVILAALRELVRLLAHALPGRRDG